MCVVCVCVCVCIERERERERCVGDVGARPMRGLCIGL
jgi:hypothetical protein